jgi:glucokinase
MILGIAVDGARARGVAVDDDGAVIARGDAAERDAARSIVAAAKAIVANAAGRSPAAVGVAFPDPDARTWAEDLSALASAIGGSVPALMLSSGNAAALAEVSTGAGRGARHIVAFSVGESVSAGVISNGSLLTGAHGLAASVRWLALNPVERDDYRRLGCLEAEGGAAGIVRRLIWRIKSGDPSRALDLAGGDYNALTIDHVLAAARESDGVAVSVIRDTIKYLGMAVANVAAIVDPEVIVLGGIAESSADLLLDPIRQECARRMPPGIHERARIEISPLGTDAAPIGAARFAQSGASLT